MTSREDDDTDNDDEPAYGSFAWIKKRARPHREIQIVPTDGGDLAVCEQTISEDQDWWPFAHAVRYLADQEKPGRSCKETRATGDVVDPSEGKYDDAYVSLLAALRTGQIRAAGEWSSVPENYREYADTDDNAFATNLKGSVESRRDREQVHPRFPEVPIYAKIPAEVWHADRVTRDQYTSIWFGDAQECIIEIISIAVSAKDLRSLVSSRDDTSKPSKTVDAASRGGLTKKLRSRELVIAGLLASDRTFEDGKLKGLAASIVAEVSEHTDETISESTARGILSEASKLIKRSSQD